MSTFGGRMSESARISIDRFTGSNLTSTAFFLSHCHQDHMIGLGEANFAHRLGQGYNLYCHSVTKELLVSDTRYVRLAKHIKTIEVDSPQIVNLPDPYSDSDHEDTVTVTFLPAGHCPGSVMMLFEFDRYTVLYTGDFRLNRTDLERMTHLHTSTGEVKPITALYFDSTFCKAGPIEMPSREDSLEALVSLVRDWLDQESYNKVFLQLAAKYGHEYLLNGLCKELGAKCHVSKAKYAAYSRVSSLSTFTSDAMVDARIHACAYWEPEPELPDPDIQVMSPESLKIENPLRKHVVSSCPECPRSAANVMTVKPSMMWFSHMKLKGVIAFKESERYYRLLYSFHSSLHEVRAMFEYLQPLKAHPCAIPQGSSSDKVMTLFSDLLPSCSSHYSSDSLERELSPKKEMRIPLRLEDIQPVGRDAYLAQFDSFRSADGNSSPPQKRFKWTWDDAFVLSDRQEQKKEESTSEVDVAAKPLLFEEEEELDLKLNASSSTPRSGKIDQSELSTSRLNGTVDFDRSLVTERKENWRQSKQSLLNSSYDGSDDMWGDEEETDPQLNYEHDITRPEPAASSSTADVLSDTTTFADDSIAIVDPPAPAVYECITLSDSPLVTFVDDDDDDVQVITDVDLPPQRCFTTAAAAATAVTTSVSSTGWLCAKKRLQ